MTHVRISSRLLIALAGIAVLLVLAGCGGGSTTKTPPTPTYKVENPIEDASKPSAIGGTIFTMAPRPGDTAGIIDQFFVAQTLQCKISRLAVRQMTAAHINVDMREEVLVHESVVRLFMASWNSNVFIKIKRRYLGKANLSRAISSY